MNLFRLLRSHAISKIRSQLHRALMWARFLHGDVCHPLGQVTLPARPHLFCFCRAMLANAPSTRPAALSRVKHQRTIIGRLLPFRRVVARSPLRISPRSTSIAFLSVHRAPPRLSHRPLTYARVILPYCSPSSRSWIYIYIRSQKKYHSNTKYLSSSVLAVISSRDVIPFFLKASRGCCPRRLGELLPLILRNTVSRPLVAHQIPRRPLHPTFHKFLNPANHLKFVLVSLQLFSS